MPRTTGEREPAPESTPEVPGQRRYMTRLWGRVEGRTADVTSAYYWIVGSTLALTVIGIMMVFSASSVENIAAGVSPFSDGLKQGLIALLGLGLMFVASRFPVAVWHRLAWPGYLLSLVLLLALFVVGTRENGNLNWIKVGGFSLQPSEMAKLGMAVWLAHILFRKERLLNQWRHVYVPAILMGMMIVGVVMIQHDLGTALILMAILLAALFFAGINGRIIGSFALVLATLALVSAATSLNRMCRITTWWTGEKCSDDYDSAWQVDNGLKGLASGGVFGTGLGQSRMKYSYIPEAHNDFIFAIIGEELGLIGAVVIVALFAILGINIFRVVVRQEQLFNRVLGGCIMVWILGQATINMAMVAGLIPVIGVPLPMISYGGSALLATLVAIGVVMSLARNPAGVRLNVARSRTSTPAGPKQSGTARNASTGKAKGAAGKEATKRPVSGAGKKS